MYNIIGGPQKGAILAREPEGYEHKIELGENDKYIIVTNFDYWDHDVREYFDYTGYMGRPRRIFAEHFLDNQEKLTPEILYQTLNLDGVFANHSKSETTLWQGIMNVEKGYFNSSVPE